MLKHIKKTFLPVMLCLVLCTCTACTSRSKEETETSETETEISKTETETSETETETSKTETETSKTETESEVSAYRNVLRKIRQNHMYPGSDTEFTEFDWEESLSIYYAIVDVTQDGIKELLLDFDYDSGPDGGITVYTYDPNAPTLVHEIGGFYTFSRFYNNGIVEEDISHGSPYGGPYSPAGAAAPNTFWPYQVWSYQADDASYTQIGFVTDWNKKEWADSIDGFSAFPDSADKDHDGIVYLLTNAKGKETAIDAADLKKWVDSYRKGAKEIPITYQRLK